MGIEVEDKLVEEYLRAIQMENYNDEEIDLEVYMRLIAIILESRQIIENDVEID